jgi:uncharacterized protein YozE (UPF0346 family)
VGDFARLVASDPNFPVESDDPKLIRPYCASGSQQEQALFDEAWEDFLEAAGARG